MKKYLYLLLIAVLNSGIVSAQFNPEDPAEPGNKYRLTVDASPTEGGSVYGGGNYKKNEVVYLSAYARNGYTFDCWKNGDEVISSLSSFDYVMPAISTKLTAYFIKDEEGGSGDFNPVDPVEPNSPDNGNVDNDSTYHTLTIIKEPVKGGQMNYEGSVRIKAGATLYLYATTSDSYIFDGWYQGDKLLSIQTSYAYTMWNKDDTLTVKFTYSPYDPNEPGSSENKEYILITSQAELEKYAGMEEFPRSVRIIGTDITSLQSLSSMKAVNGDLRIENTSLTSLAGLDNLTKVTGKLMVLQNRMLTTMDGIYSWSDIYYVLIEGNPELTNYCSMIDYALKGNGAFGAIRENGYNPSFAEIANDKCSKMDDIFKVEICNAFRQLDKMHFVLTFSNEPKNYSDVSSVISVTHSSENLSILFAEKKNFTYHVYTSLPTKEEDYKLTVANTFENVYAKTLNQNGNSFLNEEDDKFEQNYAFNKNELYVINQAPREGTLGEGGYTDVAFNEVLAQTPSVQNFTITSPSGKSIEVKSVEFVDSVVPQRYRINYEPLYEDGIYSFALSSTNLGGSTGKKMIVDFESTIELPAVNLIPSSVTCDSEEWTSGKTAKLIYTVTNDGDKVAEGKVVDVVYLSSSDSWNSEAKELYRDTVEIRVNSGGRYSNEVEVSVPMLSEGQYYLIVKSNVAQTVKENTYADNVFASDPQSIVVEELSESNRKFSLARGESKLFKLPTVSETNIEVIDNENTANMYLGYYTLPDVTGTAKKGSVTILNADASTMYYLLVANNTRSSEKVQQCDISLRNFALEVTSVGISEIIKYGKAWIPVEVNGCSDVPAIYLMDANGNKYRCVNIEAKSETSFFAQFDTDLLPLGTYSVYVDCNGITGLLNNAVTIKGGTPEYSLTSKLVLPETSRIGSTITAYIDFCNTGNVDMPIPLFILSGMEGSTYTLPDGSSFTNEVHILGLNTNGVISTLRPGESARVNVDITIPTVHISPYNYTLKTLGVGCDGMDEPFYLQWLNIDPEIVVGNYTNEEWIQYCNELKAKVGDNWNDFIWAISNVCQKYLSSDDLNYDAHLAYNLLLFANESEVFSAKSATTPRKSYYNKPEIEPGTVYIWRNSQWLPLVEAQYDEITDATNSYGIEVKKYNFREWKQTNNCSGLSISKVFFISHGMNNYHTEGWIASMANALSSKGGIVLCVDWGYWSSAGGPIPTVSAGYIDQAVSRTYEALNVAFNGNKNSKVNIGRFHFIGHSHGAHLCGRLTKKYGIKAQRITALDASEELSHLAGSRTQWNAQYIDYYKSSVTCGTEYLVGDDNFILASGDEKFTNTGMNIIEDIARHGYACDWFISTIQNSDAVDIGLSWYNKRNNYKEIINHSGWDGVINGPKFTIEGYSNYIKDHESSWNYTSPWYEAKGAKTSEWLYKDAFSGVIEYCIEGIKETDPIQCGTSQTVNLLVKNSVDNFTIPLKERQYKMKACFECAMYVSMYGQDDCSLKKGKDKTYSLNFANPIYYLGFNNTKIIDAGGLNAESQEVPITFNITTNIWNELAGNKKDDNTIEAYLWVIAGKPQYNEGTGNKVSTVSLWKGELDPTNNYKAVKVTLKNPKLACFAGDDKTYKMSKGETLKKISVVGEVLRDNGKKLTFLWEKLSKQFSSSQTATIELPVGTHTLKFKIHGDNQSKAKALVGTNYNTETDAEDEVVITIKPYTPGDEDDEGTNTASSWDPNEKVGIKGVGSGSCVLPTTTMDYSIYFENDAEKAQMAAQRVIALDTLDTAFDLSTFEFTGAYAANTFIDVPAGQTECSILTDLRPANNLLLQTDLKLDVDTRVVSAEFLSIDPETGEFTKDVWAGFLPPNDSTHVGEGHFSYKVNLAEDVKDGYEVCNQAHIYFDYNEPISTNTTMHTVDTSAPTSVASVPSETIYADSVAVTWTGSDIAGIKSYDIYYAQDNGEFKLWKEDTQETSAIFKGQEGHHYSFFSLATDSLGWTEEMKSVPDATVSLLTNGIDEQYVEDKMEIYPFPFHDVLNVKYTPSSAKADVSIMILSADGKIIDRITGCNRNGNVDVTWTRGASLIPGIYFVTVYDNNNSHTKKILKQ